MKLSLARCVVVAGLASGCIEPHLVQCSDGRMCPASTICDVENTTCIDPLGVSVPTGEIDFASVPCDDSATVTVPLRNYGVSPIDFDASTTVSGVKVSPATGAIAPGGSLELVVTASPGLTIPGAVVQGTLVIATSYEILERPLRLTALGGLVTIDATVDFGESGVPGDITRPFTLKNAGNAAVDALITMPGGSPFTASVIGPVRLEAATERSIDLRFRPTTIDSYLASATLSYEGRVCQPPPTSVALSGVASGDPILASLTVIDFGATGCEVGSESREVTLASNLTTDQTLSVAVTGTNALDYSAAAPTDALAPNGTASIEMVRRAIPLETAIGAKSATLTVTATPSGDAKVISLLHQVVGPVLTASQNMLDFGVIPLGDIVSTNLLVSNTGNDVAAVNVSVNGTAKSKIVVTPNPFLILPGAVATVTVQVKAAIVREVFTDVGLAFKSEGQCGAVPKVVITGEIQ